MKTIKLSDIQLLDIGNKIQLYGAIYSSGVGEDCRLYFLSLPDEPVVFDYIKGASLFILDMDLADWEIFLRQSDVLDTQGPAKAILRKSQRQIDQNISWSVYRRDEYRCRYCGRDSVPLTVDHIILWEVGGATTEENLLSSCRRCNKLRGSMDYADWMDSKAYRSVSGMLGDLDRQLNERIVAELDRLRSMSVVKQRSR